MNPILAANLVSLGRDILQTATPVLTGSTPSEPKAFEGMLTKACENKVAGANELSDILKRLEVKDLSGVKEARENVANELRANPEVSAFLSQNPDSEIYAQRSPDGELILRSSSGKTLQLKAQSSAGRLLSDYLALSSFLGKDVSADRPGEILLRA